MNVLALSVFALLGQLIQDFDQWPAAVTTRSDDAEARCR